VAQEKAPAFNGRKIDGQFQFDRDKTVYLNHYFYIDDEEFGPPFVKACRYALWSIKLCLNRHEWTNNTKRWMAFCRARNRRSCGRSAMRLGLRISTGYSADGLTAFCCRRGPKSAGQATTGTCRF
jgi:hypothetical protein